MSARPSLAAPRVFKTLEAVRNATGGFDVDAFHVMEERDNALIADEILHGAGSSKFVYNFEIAGTTVTGISVVGARHLANHYGSLKHRLVASVQKTGSLFTFTSYPSPGMPMDVRCATIPELEGEPDFYGAVVEITDIKTGNAIQVERRENRFEKKRNGEYFERPNYATIAQSKAYRNGILGLVPQDVQLAWKGEMLKLGKTDTITASVIDEKRSAVLRFAASKGIALIRQQVEALTMDQIAGLADAAREGAGVFNRSLDALGLKPTEGVTEDGEVKALDPPAETKKAAAEPKKAAPPKAEAKKSAPAPQPQQDESENPAPPPEEREEAKAAPRAEPERLAGRQPAPAQASEPKPQSAADYWS